MKVGVIGGGAAGLLAALKAAENGAEVTLLEGNEKLGKKIYITGKGRCNLTNAAREQDFFKGFAHNGRFLYSAMSRFSNEDMMALMEALSVKLKVERGERVFPESEKASDVTKALERALSRAGVQIRLHQKVVSLEKREDGFVLLPGGAFKRVVVATGGVSYPSTGSDGSGFRLAKSLGHSVTELRPSLIPIETKEDWPGSLSGLSLKNVRLSLKKKDKLLFQELGEMLFTHFGVSGPLALSLSAYAVQEPLEDLELLIDMKPGLSLEQLDKRIQRDIAEDPRKRLLTLMGGLVPRAMGPVVLRLSGIGGETAASQLAKAQRETLARTLKAVPLRIRGFRPIEEAIITRGGIPISEVNPKTMESKLVKGLYFCGEMLDVDGFTGGFNLQIAWSTGALAGMSAAGLE